MYRTEKDLKESLNRAKHKSAQRKEHLKSKNEVRDSDLPEDYLLMRAAKFHDRGSDWFPMARKLTRMAEEIMELRKTLSKLSKTNRQLLNRLKGSANEEAQNNSQL